MRPFSAWLFVAEYSGHFYKLVSTILFEFVILALLLTISDKCKELCVSKNIFDHPRLIIVAVVVRTW